MIRKEFSSVSKSYRIGWLCLFLLISSPLTAQPVLHHAPPQEAVIGQNLALEFSLTGYIGRVVVAKAYFRFDGESTYRTIDLMSHAPGWQGEIPARLIRGGSLNYFISVLLDNQSILTWPAANPYNRPHQIKLLQAGASTATRSTPKPGLSQGQPPAQAPAAQGEARPVQSIEQQPAGLPSSLPSGKKQPPLPNPQSSSTDPTPAAVAGDTLQLLTPDQDGTYAADEVTFAVSYFSDSSELSPREVQVELDGLDVTSRVEISAALITYDPPPLASGRHSILIKAMDSRGRAIPPLNVRFFIQSEDPQTASDDKRPTFQAHAYMDAMNEAYGGNSEGIAMAGVDFSGKVSSFNYRGTMFLTSLENKSYQPRNRFGFGISNRWIGISGGDFYPKMHELIVAGKRVRGLSGYVHLGLFNIDVVYGQMQRPVQTGFSAVRSLSGAIIKRADGTDSLRISRYGTFGQSIIGVRPSLGDGRVFQLGLTLARIRDDSSSIKMGIRPKDNLVLGPDVKLALFSGRITFTASAAFSLLTQDISSGPTTAEDIKRVLGSDTELPVDPADMADILILNDSTVPLNPADLNSLAYHLNLRINQWGHSINLGYRSIGAEYASLANPWLRKDLRGLYFQDRFRLYQNKIYLNLGYEQYADNFSEQNGNPKVDLRTVNYGVSLFPGGIYPQVSFSLRDQLRDNHVQELTTDNIAIRSLVDTLITRDEREKIWYRDMVTQISQGFQLLEASHQLSLSYIASRNIDDFKEERASTLISPDLSNRIAMLSLSTRFTIPLVTMVSYSANHSEGSAFRAVDYGTYAVNGEYSWLQNRWSSFAEFRLVTYHQKIEGAEDLDLNRTQWRLGGRWNISARQSLLLEAQMWRYTTDNTASAGADNDSVVRLRYDRYF